MLSPNYNISKIKYKQVPHKLFLKNYKMSKINWRNLSKNYVDICMAPKFAEIDY